ncbi:hypothetical protein AB0N29_19565 [Nocardioides sp. NPDC092400]|uniref:hypothetical protein n=1 Tax=Nocardioides sp. NPDC092400 TaxID=3155196 RepID=UPI0034126E8E
MTALAMLGALAVGALGGWFARGGGDPTNATASATVTVTAEPTDRASADDGASEPRGAPEDAASRHTIRGTLQLTVNRNPEFKENCTGFEEEGYGDIHVGQQVVVTDGNGTTFATGALTACKFSPLESPQQARGLLFDFTVSDVPAADFYRVQVGTGTRGALTISADDMERNDWKVALNL